jgi:CHAT domain-containing protein
MRSPSRAITSAASCWRACVLAWKGAALARAAEERLARDSPALRPQFAELAEARDRLARLALATPLPDERAAWLRQLAELRKRKEELEGALADRSDAFRRQRQRKPPTARDVATALPPRAAVLDFLVYRDYTALKPVKGRQRPQRVLAAFVLRNGKEPALVPLGNAETVTREAAAWRTALVGGDAAALRTTGAALAARVWAPLRAHLDGASTILAAPDGPLCGLPLAALPGGKDGTYLGEERAFAQVTSGLHVLELYAAAAAKNRGLLAVGGIDYGAAKPGAAAAFPPLPGARLEAEAVRGLFARSFAGEPVALLDGARATRHGLCDAAQRDRYRVIHVAGHGFYTSAAGQAQAGSRGPGPQPLAPFPEGALRHEPLLLSGLALAGANAGPDGILTAAEVSGLDLRGTELVVLSACETGLGDLDRAGEGLLGLQRAFQQAGARTLVTSLWKVDDAATALLMEKFYEGFCAQKRGKLEALRQAQLFVLRNPDAVERRRQGLSAEARKRGLNLGASRPLPGGGKAAGRSHPALWAAFVLSGDGR